MKYKNPALHILSDLLSERLKDALPGPSAHEIMRARYSGSLKPRFEHSLPPRPGSVLILLYEQHGRIWFPLIKRQEYAGVHSGQVSLPGGKAEPGEDLVETAVRESEEEIGVSRNELVVLGRLSNFHVLPSNILITPVVASCKNVPVFLPDPYEVARVFSASIEDLLEDNAIREKEIMVARDIQMSAPHFEVDGEIVWGATAMILSELRHVIQEIIQTPGNGSKVAE